MKKQPAYINYFFKGGYVEFANTIKNAFARCGRYISHSASQLSDAWYDLGNLVNIWYLLLKCITFGDSGDDFEIGGFFFGFWALIKFFFFLFKMILGAVITPVITLVMSILHSVILGIFFLITYLYFGIVKFIDFLYNHLKNISASCPSCQKRYSLPAYVCECGANHSRLVPSRYGIMKRKCECGRKLSTSFLNGRHKLPGKWLCPNCGYELNSDGLQVDICIPVVGGTSSGKTCFINMALHAIESKAASDGLVYEYVHNDMLGDPYEENKSLIQQGYCPNKTDDQRLKYYQFYLTPKKVKVRNLISFCDVAGEAYESNDALKQQLGFRYASAFLMVVDPLSIKTYRESLDGSIDLSAYKASNKSMDEVLSSLVNTLQNMYNLSSKDMLKTDVLVLFSKCDIPGLDEMIGKKAVGEYMGRNKVKDRFAAQNAVCERFLKDNDEVNFLNSLKSKFKSVQFFTCSALGHTENGAAFTPDGVYEPALWIIDKVSPSINLKKLWGKSI